MATFTCFEEIIAWQKARVLNQRVSEFIASGRFKTNFRLINQIEGSAGSVMDNIAEGYERNGNKEFVQFLYIAKGSCGELRSQLYRALDSGYITQTEFNELYEMSREVTVILQKLITYLSTSDFKGPKYKNRNNSKT
jgi:four helix bundle protein